MLGLVFALLAVGAGLALMRALRLSDAVAPVVGLAALGVLTVWTTRVGLPPAAGGAMLVVLAVVGLASQPRRAPDRWTTALLALAVAAPAALLGAAFAGVEVPASAHDGAFHVETIDVLRNGGTLASWYPLGFHTSVAAVLALLPWLDTARGTLEIAQGLAILTPLAVFALGAALRLPARVAASGACVAALTFLFPYDYHLWGGWPLGMSVPLALGIWAVALRWLARPDLRWAALGGLLAGAIVLTHGTELYTSLLGLLVIAAFAVRQLNLRPLALHLAVALGAAVVVALPYLPTLLAWAQGGGATVVGAEILDYSTVNPDMMGKGDWLQYALGVTGAGSMLDLPLRLALLALGLRRAPRLLVYLWLAFSLLLFALDLLDVSLMQHVFILTFPWLVDHRPRQIAVLLASLIEAAGVVMAIVWLRTRLTARPLLLRRSLVAVTLLLGFFAEGSAVGVYKRLNQAIAEQSVYSKDDRAAMSWLRQHAGPGDLLVNNTTADAGIWAPYKANVAILLPRSPLHDFQLRQTIAQHADNLAATPVASAEACALGVDYLYQGALDSPHDVRLLPPRAALEQASDLQEVFRSGDAVIFKVRLPCPSR
jgi:hypothetical protein